MIIMVKENGCVHEIKNCLTCGGFFFELDVLVNQKVFEGVIKDNIYGINFEN